MADSTQEPLQKIESAHLKGGDIPLRPFPSIVMAQSRTNGSSHYASENNHSSHARPGGGGSIRIRSASSLLTLDDYNLISLGYKPVMSRSLNWLSQTGIALTSSNVLCGIVTLYGLTLTNGGPAWATWSYLVIGTMSFIVSLCLAELASAYPTTGGAHHWVYELGSARKRPFLTWMAGWLTVAGSVASASSVAFYFSSALGEILFFVHKIALTPGILVMFHLGAVLFWQLINLFPIRGFGYISAASGIYIVGVIVTFAITLLTHAQVEAGWVYVPFTTFLNYSGNSSAVYAALSSTLMASFVFCPQDTVVRMSEESRRPEKVLPRLIPMTSLVSLILGFPIVLGLNYGILHPIKGLLDEAVPAVDVILMTLGRPLGITFVALILTGIFFTGLTRLSIASRVAYAFARDGGLPKSSYWNYLQSRRKTPQRVSWLVTACCMSGIFPFYWGDGNAFHWIASLACVATNLSFVIPLWIRLTSEGALNHIPGPFSLGSLSRLFHIISILWLLFLSVALMLPMTFPVTIPNFNYTSAAVAGILALSAVSWWLKAQFRFSGAAKEESRAAARHFRTTTGSLKNQYSFGSSIYGGGGGDGTADGGRQGECHGQHNSLSPDPERRFLGGARTPPPPLHLRAHQAAQGQASSLRSMSNPPSPLQPGSLTRTKSTENHPLYYPGVQRNRQQSFTRHSRTKRHPPADPYSSGNNNSFNGGGSSGGAQQQLIKSRTIATTATSNSIATSTGGGGRREDRRNTSGRVSMNPSTIASRSQISLNPVHTSTTHSSTSRLPSGIEEREGRLKDNDHMVSSILDTIPICNSTEILLRDRDRDDLCKTIASSSLSPSSQPSPSHSKTTSSVTPEEDFLRLLTNSSSSERSLSPSPAQLPGLPEISIAPPTTISSRQSQSQVSFATSSDVHIVHEDTTHQAYDRHEFSQRYVTPTVTTTSPSDQIQTAQTRPFNATESIFPNLVQTHNTNNNGNAAVTSPTTRITIDTQHHQHPLQQTHLRSTTESVRCRPPSPYPHIISTDFSTTEDNSSFYSTPLRTPTTPTTTLYTHSKQPSYNSPSDLENDDDDTEHLVDSKTIGDLDCSKPQAQAQPQPQAFRPPPPPKAPTPPLPHHPLHTPISPSLSIPPTSNIHLETLPTLLDIRQEDPSPLPPSAPTTNLPLLQSLQKRAEVGNTEKIIDIMDVDDTFDEQYNPVISAYQSSHDLFKHFAAAPPAAALAAAALIQQQQQQQQQQHHQMVRMHTSLPPPPRRRYPIPISPTSPNSSSNIVQAQNLPPLSPFEDKTYSTSRLLIRHDQPHQQQLHQTTPDATATATATSNDKEVHLAEKEASIAQWAQEQAAIEEHRLEKQQHRSKVRALAKNELRKTHGHRQGHEQGQGNEQGHGHAQSSVFDTSIRPLDLAAKSRQKPLLDANGDDDHFDDEDPSPAGHYKNSTFGLLDTPPSIPLKGLLEKDDDPETQAVE